MKSKAKNLKRIVFSLDIYPLNKTEPHYRQFDYMYTEDHTQDYRYLFSRQTFSTICYLIKRQLRPSGKRKHQADRNRMFSTEYDVFLSLSDEERRELKISEKQIVQIELLRESSSEETFIKELNVLKRCEILAQSEPVLIINPKIAAGDDVVVTAGPLAGLQAKVLRRTETPAKYISINASSTELCLV